MLKKTFKTLLPKILLLTAFSFLVPLAASAQEKEELNVMAAGDSFLKSWNVTLFNIASQEHMTYNRKSTGQRSIDTYTYFSFNKKINEDQKISLRVPFTFNTSGQNKYGDHLHSDFKLQDIHLSYALYDLGYIGDVDLSGNFKVYLPTGDYSRDSGMIAKFRFETFFEYSFGQYSSISYGIKPDIFWQSRTATFNYDTPTYNDGNYKFDPRSTNKLAELEHFVELVLDINKYFSFKPRIGFDEAWYYSSNIEDLDGRHSTKAFYQVAFSIRPVRGINFLVGFSNRTTLQSNKGKDIAFGQPENNQYFVMTNAYLF